MKLSLSKRIRVKPAETSMVVTIVMFTQSFSVVRASFSSIQFALGLMSITSFHNVGGMPCRDHSGPGDHPEADGLGMPGTSSHVLAPKSCGVASYPRC